MNNVEEAARIACPEPPGHDHRPDLDQGCAWALMLCETLADAGLLARPQPSRDDIARTLYEVGPGFQLTRGKPWEELSNTSRENKLRDADAVLALLKGGAQ